MPPMSAWWPREATKNSGSRVPIGAIAAVARNTGAITVTSGRCVPPLYGAFSTNTSPRLHRARAPVDDRPHALAHRAQVHRHVRRVGDQVALGVEQRAGEVEPLLDVDRVRRVGERDAHLLGDRHEQVVEHLEQHRIGRRADRVRALRRLDALEHEMVARRQRRAPAGLDDGRRIALADDRRSVDRVARPQVLARVDGRVAERAVRVDAVRLERRERAVARRERGRGVRRPTACGRSPRPRSPRRRAPCPASGSRIAAGSGARTRRRSRATIARPRNLERRVGAFVLHVQRARGARSARRRCPAARPRRAPPPRARRTPASSCASVARVERRLDRLLAQRAHVGEPHAVRGQHAGQRMDEHARHAERVGDQARVLAAGAAEAAQRVLGDVVAALRPRCA